MAFDFPTSPADGTRFSPAGGPTYVFSNGVWKIEGSIGAPGNLSMSDLPPSSPQNGQMWWETDSGNLFAWFNDGDSAQWVQINIPGVTGLATAQTRNRIVNGAMQHSQENLRASLAAAGAYVADQWLYSFSGPTGSSAASADGLPDYIRMWSAGGYAAPAAGAFAVFNQKIEGARVADFGWGTAGALPAVLRFKARSASAAPQVFSAAVRNPAYTRSFVRNFTVTPTFQEFAMPMPGETTGVWPTDNVFGLDILFCGMAGATSITASPNSWQTGNFFAATGIGNIFTAASQGIDIADVGLHLDPLGTGIAPRWEMPDETQELATCQRYWQKLPQMINLCGYSVPMNIHFSYPLLCTMRVLPALSFALVSSSNATMGGAYLGSPNTVSYYHSVTATGASYVTTDIMCNARM